MNVNDTSEASSEIKVSGKFKWYMIVVEFGMLKCTKKLSFLYCRRIFLYKKDIAINHGWVTTKQPELITWHPRNIPMCCEWLMQTCERYAYDLYTVWYAFSMNNTGPNPTSIWQTNPINQLESG